MSNFAASVHWKGRMDGLRRSLIIQLPRCVGVLGRSRVVGCSFLVIIAPMPHKHKHNADRHRHIPKMSFRVQSWPAYEAGLRRRGSLTLWIEDAALGDSQTTGLGGQARYTGAGIRTSLLLRTDGRGRARSGATGRHWPE
jgi:hypothetical protein